MTIHIASHSMRGTGVATDSEENIYNYALDFCESCLGNPTFESNRLAVLAFFSKNGCPS